MLLRKSIHYVFLLAYIFLAAGKAGNAAGPPESSNRQKGELFKTSVFAGSDGIMQSGPEISSGRVLQHNSFKLKNSFGSSTLQLADNRITGAFISSTQLFRARSIKVPLYLFNRRLLV